MSASAPMQPISLRLSPMQLDRLKALRGKDGLAIQEHIRRGIDFYLNSLVGSPVTPLAPPMMAIYGNPPPGPVERDQPLPAPTPQPTPERASAASPAPVNRKKLVYR